MASAVPDRGPDTAGDGSAIAGGQCSNVARTAGNKIARCFMERPSNPGMVAQFLGTFLHYR